MEKFSLFLESSDRDNLLKSIFLNPFERTPKLVLADWLDENGKYNDAKLLRLVIKYQEDGDDWSDNDDRNLYVNLRERIRRSLSKSVRVQGLGTIFYRPPGKSEFETEQYVVSTLGLLRVDRERGREVISVEDLPGEVLDAVVYMMAGNIAGDEARNLFTTGLGVLWQGMLEREGDDPEVVVSLRRANSGLWGVKSMLAALGQDDKIPYRMENYHFDFLQRRIEEFATAINRDSQSLRSQGFDPVGLIKLLNELRSKLPTDVN